ncbi:MAG: hypothetical protein JHD35_22215 [Sphingopyxis sp.]|nr:hypothetical protein [Sphingopyxis sp.]
MRIVDAECGDGRLLVQAARYARALGFTAIDGRGIDSDPSAINGARMAAARVSDPAIGLSFEAGDMLAALADEAEFPADILLWEGGAGARPHVADAVVAAGCIVIGAARPAAGGGMTRRDRAWRIAGFVLMAAGYAIPLAGELLADRSVQQAIAVLIGMPLALAGALLIVQGDRVPRIFRVERSRHRDLVLAIRARRRSGSGRQRFGRELAD